MGSDAPKFDAAPYLILAAFLGQFGCDEDGHPNHHSHHCADYPTARQFAGRFERAVPPPKETR